VNKGIKAEEEFRKWLDEKNIPYLQISNAPGTLSIALKGKEVRRPDFLIFVRPFLGIIMVDVQDRKIEEGKIIIDKDETWAYIRFERESRLPVWYAISNKGRKYKEWYWIPVSKVIEVSEEKVSRRYGPFYKVDIEHFALIRARDRNPLSKLFETEER